MKFPKVVCRVSAARPELGATRLTNRFISFLSFDVISNLGIHSVVGYFVVAVWSTSYVPNSFHLD